MVRADAGWCTAPVVQPVGEQEGLHRADDAPSAGAVETGRGVDRLLVAGAGQLARVPRSNQQGVRTQRAVSGMMLLLTTVMQRSLHEACGCPGGNWCRHSYRHRQTATCHQHEHPLFPSLIVAITVYWANQPVPQLLPAGGLKGYGRAECYASLLVIKSMIWWFAISSQVDVRSNDCDTKFSEAVCSKRYH